MTEEEIELNRLNKFLDSDSPKVATMFEELFKNQQQSFSDEELEEAVKNGFKNIIEKLSAECKAFIENQYIPIFKEAVKAGAKEIEQKYSISLDFNDSQLKDRLDSYSEKFLNTMIDEMKRSISTILEKCEEKGMTPKETAQFIHPTIGLYPRQAVANWNFQRQHGKIIDIEAVVKIKKAPVKKFGSIEDELEALKYALRQIEQRAHMIADTGLATAFNLGLHEIIRKAIELGLLGKVEKTWITAQDQKVCDKCLALSVVTIDFFEKFYESDVYTGETPPLHPNCRCAVVYKEELPPGVRPLTPEQMTTPNLPPEPLGTVPNNPADKEEALKYYEGQIADQPIENGITITPEGEVYHTTGDENTLNPILELGDKLNGAIVTHNHPIGESEYSFSKDDMNLFMNRELEALRGIDEKFVYELNRDPNEIDDPVFFGDVNEFNYRHSQVVDKAKDYGIGYRRWSRE